MNKWYRSGYRRNLVDMHIDAWDPVFLSRFDPEVYLKCLQEARIQNPMIYTHSHVGYCNFPTRTGGMHPGVPRRRQNRQTVPALPGERYGTRRLLQSDLQQPCL